MTAPPTFGQQLDQMRRGSHALIHALHGIDRACAHFAAVANAPVPPPPPPARPATVTETVQSFGPPPVPPATRTEQTLAETLTAIRRRLLGQPQPSPDLQQSGPPVEERFVRPGGGRMEAQS